MVSGKVPDSCLQILCFLFGQLRHDRFVCPIAMSGGCACTSFFCNVQPCVRRTAHHMMCTLNEAPHVQPGVTDQI